MNEPPVHPSPGHGMLGALVAVVVSVVPAWMGWQILVLLLRGEFDARAVPLALGILVGCIVLIVGLLRLAYRMWTGIGRKKDGGLVGPILLMLFSIVVGVMGVALVFVSLKDGSLKPVLGGFVFSALGVNGILLAVGRLRAERPGDDGERALLD